MLRVSPRPGKARGVRRARVARASRPLQARALLQLHQSAMGAGKPLHGRTTEAVRCDRRQPQEATRCQSWPWFNVDGGEAGHLEPFRRFRSEERISGSKQARFIAGRIPFSNREVHADQSSGSVDSCDLGTGGFMRAGSRRGRGIEMPPNSVLLVPISVQSVGIGNEINGWATATRRQRSHTAMQRAARPARARRNGCDPTYQQEGCG